MPLKLISATPSAYARINRIALLEKSIPFELLNEVPWDSTTATPEYNPLEKLPILILEDGKSSVYDSAHIQEYIIQKYADRQPTLLPEGIDSGLQARQIQTLAEGMMEAVTLWFFEKAREHPSVEWQARQDRKISGAVQAFDAFAQKAANGGEWLVDDVYSIADIAVGCALGWVEFFDLRPGWKQEYPALERWWDKISEREAFKQTMPVMFDLKDKVV